MSRIHEIAISERVRRSVVTGFLATTVAAGAGQASAFFQQTKLEGVVGSDIGGVWLSVQQIVPEFRITFQKASLASGLPFTVAPIPADLEPVTGKNPEGVSISACPNAAFCAEYGLIVGDIVIRVNNTDVKDPAAFAAAMENPPNSILLSVRRPELKMTTSRLIKIRYRSEGKDTGDGSELQETVEVKVLDVAVPFADQIEATRQSHAFFQPSAEQLEDLGKKWAALPLNAPLQLLSGQHRFVAQSHFDDALAADPALARSKFAIVLNMDGNPIQGRGGKVIDIYGIESMDAKTMEGTYVTATIASAPFPINVEFKGRFRMTRVADWSDEDDKLREAEAKKRPKEDLDKFKTLPDVPPKPGAKKD